MRPRPMLPQQVREEIRRVPLPRLLAAFDMCSTGCLFFVYSLFVIACVKCCCNIFLRELQFSGERSVAFVEGQAT